MAKNSPPWWRGVGDIYKRRYTRDQRLALLGISEDDFGLYYDLFLKHRRPDTYSEQKPDGWPQRKYRWDDSLILRHLCGSTNVAIPFGLEVDQIVLDIDNHGDRDWTEVERSVRSSIKAIPGEPIIYRSSDSEGFREIWFMKESVSRIELNNWTKRTLQLAGVTVKSGQCEVRLGSEPDRIPFGYHSMLLDPVTLEPLFNLDLKQTLRVVDEHRQLHAIKAPDLAISTDHEPHESSQKEYKKIVAVCKQSGLPKNITTNDCLLALAWHGRVQQGQEKDKLSVSLKDWITNCHNGRSKRVNDGEIEKIYNQIDRIVNDLKATPGRTRSPILSVALCREELLCLLEYPINFKTAGGLYRLLCFAKSKLLHQLNDRCLPHSPAEEKIGTNKWGTVLNDKQDIPNRARNFNLYIDLPKQLLRLLRVPNANNTARFVSDLEKIGVLKLKRKAWPDRHKARQYWVNFSFDPSGELVDGDFDQVLWKVMGFDSIHKLFSKHHADRIARLIGKQEGKKIDEEPNLAMV